MCYFADCKANPRADLLALLAGYVHEDNGQVEPVILDVALDLFKEIIVEPLCQLVENRLHEVRVPQAVKVFTKYHEPHVKGKQLEPEF